MVNNNERGILYFMGAWGVGGVEHVTAVLANEWIKRGWRVAIFAFKLDDDMLLSSVDKRVSVVIPNVERMTGESCEALRKAIIENNVSIVVNDWSLPFKTTLFIRKACKGLSVTQIVNLHNIPNNNARLAAAKNPLIKFAIRIVSGLNMHLTYMMCRKYVLLSNSFKQIFKKFAFVPFGTKLHAITNPLTLDMGNEIVAKKNVVLYVGRLEEKQKKFSRIANLWKNVLANKYPDWRLEVVGDGPDRASYEKMLAGTPRVSFEGFQNPRRYYQKSKIVLMTSAFEGFPLVLAEAMSAGCVPVALGSFPAVYDIINAKCGRVVKPPYDEVEFAKTVEKLMLDDNVLRLVSENARAMALNFKVETVVDEWQSMFEEVVHG